jgi:hypothetical protein
MTFNSWKTALVSLGLAGAFLLSAGLSGSANVAAQDGWRNRGANERRDQRRDVPQRNRGWNNRVDRNRNGINDRYEQNRNVYRNGRIDRNRNGINDRYENRYPNGRYGNNGYYGNYGNRNYGYNSAEEQKGYRDGLDRGRKDAQTNRVMDPNNSSHYRKGSAAYRAGFERGFHQSYRQYSGRRW